jgi:proteic killer suppression protein
VRRFAAFERVAQRKLAALDAADDLRALQLPGLRLELLKGDRAGTYSIRINDQWRIVFRWIDNHAERVAIEDYH